MVRQVDKSKQTKDGRKWQFITYYKNCNGERKQKFSQLYLTKKDAEEAERLFLMKRDNPLHKEFILVSNDYFENLKTKRKESTYYSYKKDYDNHIFDFFKSKYIDDININDIKNWKDYIENKKLSIGCMNKIYNVLKCIFDYAMKNYGITLNAVAICGRFEKTDDQVIKDSEKIRYITYEQFKQFISVVDDPMFNVFFTFLYFTGMRKGEVQALTWNDIDFENNQIIVNKTLSIKTSDLYKITNTKNSQNRKIKMSTSLRKILFDYKNEVSKYTDFNEDWFVFGNSRFLPETTIARKKNIYFKKAELKSITIHEFRHSHVSLLINEYINTSKTKNMKIDTAKFFLMMSNRMGHTVEVMQRTYMHLFPTIQDEIVDLLDNL